MISDEIKELVRKHLPDFPIDETERLPLDVYGWLVCNVWVPEAHARGEMTPEKLREDFMRNEGRMGEFRYDG